MLEKKCLCCGKVFLVKDYRKDSAKFCSRSCGAKYYYDNGLRNVNKDYMKGNQYRKGLKPTNSFEKGHTPWNKGLKGIHLSKNTEFKKGNESCRKVSVGTIMERAVKGVKRNFIKVAEPNTWKQYAIYLWEQENGNLPKGKVIHHINKIPNDDRIENLICLTRTQHINIHREDLINAKKKTKKGV